MISGERRALRLESHENVSWVVEINSQIEKNSVRLTVLPDLAMHLRACCLVIGKGMRLPDWRWRRATAG